MDHREQTSPHANPFDKTFLWIFLLSLVLLLIAFPTASHAIVMTAITSDGTLPTPSAVSPLNPMGVCTGGCSISGGTIRGTNQFHSLGLFNVGTLDVATFNGPSGIVNILTRVTGGVRSDIDGTIRTTIPGANLFLMNPSGIMFGPNASLDIGATLSPPQRGSFFATTANYLLLADGVGFSAIPNFAQDALLTSAPVAAFGFLSQTPAAITVQGTSFCASVCTPTFVIGGDITVGNLSAPSGQINIVSVASPGAVLLPSLQYGPNINGQSFSRLGTVTVAPGATLDVSGDPVGTVLIRGGKLVMDNATIMADNLGATDGTTAIDVDVTGDVTLTNRAAIKTQTFGPGRGGDVRISASTVEMDAATITSITSGGDGVGGDISMGVGTLTLSGAAQIQSQSANFTPHLGEGGNITIRGLQVSSAAESVDLSGRSSLLSQTFGSGDAGRIDITAKSLTMGGAGTAIETQTFGDVGNAGNITANVGTLSLTNGALIKTENSSFGDGLGGIGQGGSITVQGLRGAGSAAGSITISGPNSGVTTDTFGTGSPGDISMTVGTLSLTDSAMIAAATPFSTGPGGTVTVTADSILISAGSSISSQTFAQLAAGQSVPQITISAQTLTLDNGSINTSTLSSGPGGDVVLKNVGSVNLTNGAQINSSTSSAGRAGDIKIMNAGTVSLTGGAQINSSSTAAVPGASGNAGTITLNVSGTFQSTNSAVTTFVKEGPGAPPAGIPSNITITAGQNLNLTNGTTVSTRSEGPTDAGDIHLAAGNTLLLSDSHVTAEATQALGGSIKLTAPNLVHLIDGKVTASVQGTVGTVGGNIDIDPQFVVLQNSQLLATATQGHGGNITITGNVVLMDPSSVLDASAGDPALSGTVNIQAPVQNLSGALVPLSQGYLAATALLAQRCAARYADGQFSTFVLSGRDGLPPGPGGLLPISTYVRAPGAGTKASAMALSSPLATASLNVPLLSEACIR